MLLQHTGQSFKKINCHQKIITLFPGRRSIHDPCADRRRLCRAVGLGRPARQLDRADGRAQPPRHRRQGDHLVNYPFSAETFSDKF
jgi:hypothetical protein